MDGVSSSDTKDTVPQEDAGSGHQEVKEDADVPPSKHIPAHILLVSSEKKVDSKAEEEGASTISHPISPLPGKKEENEDQAAGGVKDTEA